MFQFEKMTQEAAESIAKWHYPEPYSFYDMENDEEDLEELLSPEARGENYFQCCSESGELIGFLCAEQEKDGLCIGLGLRPDLTGRGMGEDFLRAGEAFLLSRGEKPSKLCLYVAEFNVRAQKVYERCGYCPMETRQMESNGGSYPFVYMEKELD